MIDIKAPIIVCVVTLGLSGCQTAQQPHEPGTASASTHDQLMAEARAFGTAQGVAGAAAAFDPTGAASIPLMLGGQAAYRAWMVNARADEGCAGGGSQGDLQEVRHEPRRHSVRAAGTGIRSSDGVRERTGNRQKAPAPT